MAIPNPVVITTFIVCLASHAVGQEQNLKKEEESRKCMGTTLRIVIHAPTETIGRKALEKAFARAEELNGILSDYQDSSELMRLCSKAGGPSVGVSRELFTVLESAQELSRLTDGAFDVTIGPVTRLWRLARKSKRLPDPADLGTAFGLDACLDGVEQGDYRQHVRPELLESQSPPAADSPLAWLSRRTA